MPSPPDQKKQTQRISSRDALSMEHQRPGPEHVQLCKFVGVWDVIVACWMPDSEQPMRSAGQAVYATILDGRYLQERFVGTVFGKPFVGFGLLGYDRAAKRYVNVWCDSVGTGIITTTGISSHNGQEITFTGTTSCAMSSAPMTIRQVHRRESDEQFTLTLHQGSDGQERKCMELFYSRSRGAAVTDPAMAHLAHEPAGPLAAHSAS
jgi:hypothetical protein